MTTAGLVRHARQLVRTPSVVAGRRQYVLVLSHMRSYSSLFAHLLGSHPEIDGYAEMNLPYTRSRDLLRLRSEVARSIDGPLKGRYVLDKVLHNHHPVSRAILADPRVRPVFLIRRPAATLTSILKMNEQHPGLTLFPGEEGAFLYYRTRLEWLTSMGGDRKLGALVIRAENLVGDPVTTLARVTTFLRLDTPIGTEYSTFPLTGEPGRGDFSDTIREGRIHKRADEAESQLRPDILQAAEHSYEHCVGELEGRFYG